MNKIEFYKVIFENSYDPEMVADLLHEHIENELISGREVESIYFQCLEWAEELLEGDEENDS